MKTGAYLDEKRNREILFNVHMVITEMGNYELISFNLHFFRHTGNTFHKNIKISYDLICHF